MMKCSYYSLTLSRADYCCAFYTPSFFFIVLDLGLLRFTVSDGLIHVLHPQPYMARCEWTE